MEAINFGNDMTMEASLKIKEIGRQRSCTRHTNSHLKESTLQSALLRMLRTLGKRLAKETKHYGMLSYLRYAGDAPAKEFKPEDFKWEDIQALAHSPEAKGELMKLQSLAIGTDEPEGEKKVEVDWALWKKRLDPVMVSKFEETYKEIAKEDILPATSFDADAWLKSFDSVIEKAKLMEQASVERIKTLEKESAEIKAEMERMAVVTVDEELAANPEMAKEIDEEISQQNYY